MESDTTSNLTAEPDAASPEAVGSPVPPEVPAQTVPPSLQLRWVDLLVFVALVVISAAGFYGHARGDLYSDEADYALASVRGFEANRWDRSDRPKEPDRLVASRHFHAPLTVDLIALARRFGAEDRTIRMPFIVAGGLSVGMVYLCGLALFDRRREIAAACALLVAVSPAIVRMASHALPWSPIILELLALLWCLAEFTRDRHWGWIAAFCATLGLLFVTSEMFFVAVPAVVTALPFVLWPAVRPAGKAFAKRVATPANSSAANEAASDAPSGSGGAEVDGDADAPDWEEAGVRSGGHPLDRWGDLLRAVLLGVVLFVAIASAFWPSGLTGESVKMLRHYMMMRHSESFPVNVGNRIFTMAPRWSYAYWYWNDYKPFFVCYALGLPGLIGLAVTRKLHPSVAPLLSLTAFLLFAAHRAHIIGPEYLAHCLPFLTLLGGLFVTLVSLKWRPLATIVLLILTVPVVRWSPRVPLPGMDARAQLSRWPAAAKYLGAHWNPGDKIMVGSQPVPIARWYLVTHGNVPAIDSQFQPMPIHAPKQSFLDRLASGRYRYVAVSNMFEDHVDLDAKTVRILRDWPVAWRSDERGTGPSRLTIYEFPERSHPPAPSP